MIQTSLNLNATQKQPETDKNTISFVRMKPLIRYMNVQLISKRSLTKYLEPIQLNERLKFMRNSNLWKGWYWIKISRFVSIDSIYEITCHINFIFRCMIPLCIHRNDNKIFINKRKNVIHMHKYISTSNPLRLLTDPFYGLK